MVQQQSNLGEMTLEDFLVKAGVVGEACSNRKNTAGTIAGIDSNEAVPQFLPQDQWMQYQHPQQSLMGIYMPTEGPIAQPLHMRAGASLDFPFADISQVTLPSPLMGTVSDMQTLERKRMEKRDERRQKRLIKNRESAARSRARKQAYTNELENKVSRLEEENERLSKRKQELENMLASAPPPEPKYQLRRVASAPF